MALIAVVALAVGLMLILGGRGMRRRRGLTDAPTLDLDGRTLYSDRLGLAGRPDRVIEEGGFPIPEEWKPSARRVYDSHIAQLGAYLILIEEEKGVRAPYGYISVGDGQPPHRVENTPELRAWVLGVAKQIRAARRELGREIPVKQPAGKCRACGMREGCGQRAG